MSRRAQQVLSAVAISMAMFAGVLVPETSAAPPAREGPSRCLAACRACEGGARDRASREACWSSSTTCCEAGGKKPILRACGCW